MPHTCLELLRPIEFQIVSVPALVDIKVCGKDHFKRARERDKKVMDWLDDEIDWSEF